MENNFIQRIPQGQKELIVRALTKLGEYHKDYIKKYNISDSILDNEVFDINVLKKLLRYNISVNLTESQLDNFTSVNGVDFPLYDIPIEKVVDKIDKAIDFYQKQKEEILTQFKERGNFSVDYIVSRGKELELIQNKIWTLETAKYNG